MQLRFRSASFLVVISAFILISGVSGLAQEVTPRLDRLVHPGSVVKIRTASGELRQGKIDTVSESSLALRGEAGRVIQLADIDTLQARVGRRPILFGTMVGASAAVAVILVAAATADDPPPCGPGDWFCHADFGPSDEAVAAILITIGAGAGAGVGAMLPRAMKEVYRAPITSRTTIAPLLTRGRIGVTVSIPF